MKKQLLTLGLLTCIMALGCSNNAVSEEPDVPAEAVETEQSGILANLQEEYVTTAMETPKEVVSTVHLEINPSFTLSLDENNVVVAISAVNEDAEDVLDALGDYFGKATDGVELKYVMRDIAITTANEGYALDDYSIEVSVEEGEVPDFVMEEACWEAAAEVYRECNIEASCVCEDMNINAAVNENNIEYIANPESHVCDWCHGNGWYICNICNGSGTTTYEQEHEERVRNDYVCPVCGGKGWVDDGMHGGETAICGNCGGGVDGAGNGEFNQLAYDTVIVTETITDTCPSCNGAGQFPCQECGGSGWIIDTVPNEE